MLHLFYQYYFIASRQKIKYKFTLVQKKSLLQQKVVVTKYRPGCTCKNKVLPVQRMQKLRFCNRSPEQGIQKLSSAKRKYLSNRFPEPCCAKAKLLQGKALDQKNKTSNRKRLQINTILLSDLRINKGFAFSLYQPKFAHNNFSRLNYNKKLSCLYPTNLDKMSFLSSDLANLGLSLKTYTFLKRKEIHKIGKLVKYSSKSLLQLLNKDREMFAEINRCILFKTIY